MLPTQLTAPATGASTGTSAGSGLSLRTQGSGPGSTARLASARLASGVCATGVCATGVCATGARRLRYWRLRDWRRRARAWPTVDAPNRQLRLREAVGERVRRQPLDLTAPRLRVCPSRRRTRARDGDHAAACIRQRLADAAADEAAAAEDCDPRRRGGCGGSTERGEHDEIGGGGWRCDGQQATNAVTMRVQCNPLTGGGEGASSSLWELSAEVR